MLDTRHREGRPDAPARLRMRVVLTGLLLLVLASTAAAGPPTTDGPWGQSALHLKVLLSALTYERTLQRSAGDVLRIGVLFDPGNADSLLDSGAVITALEHQAGEMTFRDRALIVSGIPLTDSVRLRKAVQKGVDVIYLVEGIDSKDLARVLAITRDLKIISITGVETYVRQGVSLGAVVREGHPHVIIHYDAAKAEGAEFSSQLLQLSEIVGRAGGNDD